MTPDRLLHAMEATWPAAFCHRTGPWLVREGQGGGQRVSAVTPAGDWQQEDIGLAEAAMRGLDQMPLFMIRENDGALDAALEAQGYAVRDPVVLYSAALGRDTGTGDAFPHWPPLAIVRALWADAGIGPGRIAVMDRVKGAKAAILGRTDDAAAGAAFVACDGTVAMIHALEVAPPCRRAGLGRTLMRAAAAWATEQGATHLGLAVTKANDPARALYVSLGMAPSGAYHYRAR